MSRFSLIWTPSQDETSSALKSPSSARFAGPNMKSAFTVRVWLSLISQSTGSPPHFR